MMFVFGSHQILWTPTIYLSWKDSNGGRSSVIISISKITVRYCGAPVGSEREYIFLPKIICAEIFRGKKKKKNLRSRGGGSQQLAVRKINA